VTSSLAAGLNRFRHVLTIPEDDSGLPTVSTAFSSFHHFIPFGPTEWRDFVPMMDGRDSDKMIDAEECRVEDIKGSRSRPSNGAWI